MLLNILFGVKHGISQFFQTNFPLYLSFFRQYFLPLPFEIIIKYSFFLFTLHGLKYIELLKIKNGEV
jgi:hypothetical protein